MISSKLQFSGNFKRAASLLFFIFCMTLSGCGGGSSGSASAIDPVQPEVDEPGDPASAEPEPESGNISPSIDQSNASSNESNSLEVTFAWQVSDIDGDSVSCVLDPGSGLAPVLIADCLATTDTVVEYSVYGEVTATLTATDGNSGSASAEISVSVESLVALSGVVSSYPESGPNPANDDSNGLLLSDDSVASSLSREDMIPAEALVSLFLLTDVDYADPIATVKTGQTGEYVVTASDVRNYLTAAGLIAEGVGDADVMEAFQALGRLQVRALIVSERNGEQQAIAIQSIADPANVDESGVPVPVAIDPIVHRVVKSIVDQIRESVSSLENMGLPPGVVDELVETVISTVVVEIDRVLEETADDLILIPQGQSTQDVIAVQEADLALNLQQQDLTRLAEVLDSEEENIDDATLSVIESNVVSAEVVVADTDSALESTLDSESRGLLSSLESTISEQVTDTVEQRIEQAQQAGTDEALEEIFGTTQEGTNLQAVVAAAEAETLRQQRRSLQRFFLSLGVGVIVDENSAGDAGVIAIRLPLPAHLNAQDLPGAGGFGDRQIRLFKVGVGELDGNSDYTSDALAELAVRNDQGVAQPPFIFVPALSNVLADSLGSTDSEGLQDLVEIASTAIHQPEGNPTEADFALLDRVSVLQELQRRLENATLVSQHVIDRLIDNRDVAVSIKRLASVIADNFQWVAEDVNLTPEGFPVFSDRRGALPGGASIVDSSELIRALSLSLGKTASTTAQLLTERGSFYSQYASDAIDGAIQRAVFEGGDSFELQQALLDIYPIAASDYKDLIIGSDGESDAALAYSQARDRVASGLAAAIPAELFGQTLTSESEVNIRAALFFLDFVLRGEFLIESTEGYFTEFEIIGADGSLNSRFVPHYSNLKILEPVRDISVATLMSGLLNITEINDGDYFAVAVEQLRDGFGAIPELPEFREHDVEDFTDELGTRAGAVDMSCTVERYDGLDPEGGADQQRLRMSVFSVEFVPETGELIKGERVDANIISELVADNGPLRRTYRIEQLSTLNGSQHGRDYVLRLEIDNYQNELPELFFFVDGYVPTLDLCSLDNPLFIGPDQRHENIPGLSLISNQSRSGAIGDEVEGIDVSNFEVPGAPLYLTAFEQQAGYGQMDLVFVSSSAGFQLQAAERSDTAFAPLFGAYQDGELQVSLTETTDLTALHGVHSILGASVRSAVEAAVANPQSLVSSIDIAADVEPNRLYLMRDSDARFWVLELRNIEFFVEYDGSDRALIDVGIARVNSLGEVDSPDVAFDEAVAEPSPEGIADIEVEHHRLIYGDWLVLQNPTGYRGGRLLPAELLAFGDSEEHNDLSLATDGIVIRYAGEHFRETIQSFEDLETAFGSPPDYSKIPVRIDAGRDGLRLVKLAFDKQEKRYLMDPTPQEAGSFIGNLAHNNLVAIFDDNSSDDGPAYLARVIRDVPADDPYGNFELGLDVVHYAAFDSTFGDEREVVCFEEDDRSCPTDYPRLVFASDTGTAVGIVYDRDHDGLPALFDSNDTDPNIPGQLQSSPVNPVANSQEDLIAIHSIARAVADGSAVSNLLLETRNLYPGDIASLQLGGALFANQDELSQVLTCRPPFVSSDGNFHGFECQAYSSGVGVEVRIDSVSERSVSLELLVPKDILEQVGERVTVDYQIEFAATVNSEGSPLLCGEVVCPVRPALTGSVAVALPEQLPVIEALSLYVNGEALALQDIETLDVNRDIRIVGPAVDGAVGYELSLVCREIENSHEYLPEEGLTLFAPARGAAGEVLEPEFDFHAPRFAGRSCDLNLSAPIANDAGDIIGVSVYRREGIATISNYPPTLVDNEMKLLPGEMVCVDESGYRLHADGCDSQNMLFVYEGSDAASGEANVFLLTGPDTASVQIDGNNYVVAEGRLEADARVSFNINDGRDDFLPTCGVVSSSNTTPECAVDLSVPLEAVFLASPDLSELVLLPHLRDFGVTLRGDLNQNGEISLLGSGDYWLQVPDTDELLAINVEVLHPEFGELLAENPAPVGTTGAEVAIRFERERQQADSSDGADLLQTQVPGYIYLQHSAGFVVDIELLYIDGGELKIAWYLLDQRQPLEGGHDLNGDGAVDVEVFYDSGFWHFGFHTPQGSVEQLSANGASPVQSEGDGFALAIVDENLRHTEFVVNTNEQAYHFIVEFESDGIGHFDIITTTTAVPPAADVLFDGAGPERYFPIDLAIASPFATDVVVDGSSRAAGAILQQDTGQFGDVDADGIPDQLDVDFTGGRDVDNDGIDDIADADFSQAPDTNNNGIVDQFEFAPQPVTSQEFDSDGNGIPDTQEQAVIDSADSDGDGIPDSHDADFNGATDSDGDGVTDQYDYPFGQTAPVPLEQDTDNDSVPDFQDVDLTGGQDANANGIDDVFEPHHYDVDGDGVPDSVDADQSSALDSDGDGIVDEADADFNTAPDSDGDGVVDPFDSDSPGNGFVQPEPDGDEDGIPDHLDADHVGGQDLDADGVVDFADPDFSNLMDGDGDGIADPYDQDAQGYNPTDSSSDGVVDQERYELEQDLDADGIPDHLDVDVIGGPDQDSDGVVDFADPDTTGHGDMDGDGISDPYDPDPLTEADSDQDGVPDHLDADHAFGGDADGDGIVDYADADTSGYPDIDRDGVADPYDPDTFPEPDTDADGVPDHLDTDFTAGPDSDNDGIIDHADPDSTGATDYDGDGVSDPFDPDFGAALPDHEADSDADGIPDYLDPDNGAGPDSDGDGVVDHADPDFNGQTDADGDGITDVHDPDTDNDGIGNHQEGYEDIDADGIPSAFDLDSDGDGIPDAHEGAIDSDGDGTPDYLDSDSDADGYPDSTEGLGDSDADGTPDYLDPESHQHDSDGDGIFDAEEIHQYGTDPHHPDTDNDGLLDSDEVWLFGTDPLNPDTDGDGVPDGAEGDLGIDPLTPDQSTNQPPQSAAELDSDGDGLTDEREQALGTDPHHFDTDNDGAWDGFEVDQLATDPLNPDTDGDGYPDGSEHTDYGTNPLEQTVDSDGDGLTDAQELEIGSDPFNSDTDGDGATDGVEIQILGTSPFDPDSDGDGLEDGQEVSHGLNPVEPNTQTEFVDSDGDGLSDIEEIDQLGTDPNHPDTDGDNLGDRYELEIGTDPLNPDSDGDGLPDGAEYQYGSDQLNPDTDGDGIPDGEDLFMAPRVDSDGDGLSDEQELNEFGTSPNHADTDRDGVSDLTELHGPAQTDALQTDSDGDGVNDIEWLATEFGWLDADVDGLHDDSENELGTQIDNPDSDGDGLLDGAEVHVYHTSPLNSDTDGDGLQDALEINELGTNPANPDTDGDGLTDGDEWHDYQTNPLDQDTDGDGGIDGHELEIGTDPLNPDSDGNGVPDAEEQHYQHEADSDGDLITDELELTVLGTDPNNADSDGDGLWDGVEYFEIGSDPLASDSDGDGLSDFEELQSGSNPLEPDTDGDGLSDADDNTPGEWQYVEPLTDLPLAVEPEVVRSADADARIIAELLSGKHRFSGLFQPAGLRTQGTDAPCFGPALLYQNRPDAIASDVNTDAVLNSLPGGDLGIWSEYDESGHACSAAQLNQHLDAARRRNFAGLVAMAGVLRLLNVDEQREVLQGGTVDVTERMVELEFPGVEFLLASVSHDIGDGNWHYRVEMSAFNQERGIAVPMAVEMHFNPGSNNEIQDYSGSLLIRSGDVVEGGNCEGEQVQHLSTLGFERADGEEMRTEYRYGMFCSAEVPDDVLDANGALDPAYSVLSNQDGWGNNFSIFSANYQLRTGAGKFAYSWQAGAGDSHSRVFNVTIEAQDESVTGQAWFGFGDSLSLNTDTAGTIRGFICDWAGSGADHNLLNQAQYQSLAWDSLSERFVVGESGSMITYAPTASCTYNSDDGGSFLYDRNLNGELSDESADTVDVGAGELLPLSLAPADDSDLVGLPIWEAIEGSGYQPPIAPVPNVQLD